jgi:hypothetical protein
MKFIVVDELGSEGALVGFRADIEGGRRGNREAK